MAPRTITDSPIGRKFACSLERLREPGGFLQLQQQRELVGRDRNKSIVCFQSIVPPVSKIGNRWSSSIPSLSCTWVERMRILKDRIRSTHIHDNNGMDDKHLFPTFDTGGTVDWKKTMDLLRSRPDQYPLLLELKENAEYKHPLETCTQIFDRLENL